MITWTLLLLTAISIKRYKLASVDKHKIETVMESYIRCSKTDT